MHNRLSMVSILPHRAPMLMVSEVATKTAHHIVCRVAIDEENPFLNQGFLPGFVCLELVAQAAGVFLGLAGLPDEQHSSPSAGAIVAVRDMLVRTKRIKQGMLLTVRADFLGGSQQAAMFSGYVLFGQDILFETKVTVALFAEGA